MKAACLAVLGCGLSLASTAGAQTAPPAHAPVHAGVRWTLEQVVGAALSQHPLIEVARARADGARADRLAAAALPNPFGTLWVENVGLTGPQAPGLETASYLTWPLEPLLQRPSRVRRAEGEQRAADASFRLARRHVAGEAVRAFFQVALAQESTAAAALERQLLEQLAAYNRARVEEGVTAEAELLRTRVEVDRAGADVAFAEVELGRRIAELLPYLGEGAAGGSAAPAFRAEVSAQASPGTVRLPPLDVALTRAREGRAEIAAGRARSDAAAAAAGLERRLGAGQFGVTAGNKRAEGQNSLLAGVEFTLPLFNRNRSGVARALSERRAAEHELDWIDRTVHADVQAAHGAATRLSRQLAGLEGSFVGRAEDLHRLTLGAYQEGGATLLQVLDATRVLADVRLTFARASFAERQSLFELALAIGTEPEDALALVQTWSHVEARGGRQGGAP